MEVGFEEFEEKGVGPEESEKERKEEKKAPLSLFSTFSFCHVPPSLFLCFSSLDPFSHFFKREDAEEGRHQVPSGTPPLFLHPTMAAKKGNHCSIQSQWKCMDHTLFFIWIVLQRNTTGVYHGYHYDKLLEDCFAERERERKYSLSSDWILDPELFVLPQLSSPLCLQCICLLGKNFISGRQRMEEGSSSFSRDNFSCFSHEGNSL